jgi:hypothetical protein
MPKVRFVAGAGIFLFTTTSRPALGATQPPIQWVLETLSLVVKQLVCETDHSPLPHTSSCHGDLLSTGYIFMAWHLVKHSNSFTLLSQ